MFNTSPILIIFYKIARNKIKKLKKIKVIKLIKEFLSIILE
jgi:hypothetical protein